MLIKANNPHGGDVYANRGRIDFSANINPFGPPEIIKNALEEALKNCAFYPDAYCRGLARATERAKGLPRGSVLFGNGAAELVYSFAYALPKGTRALVVEPAFCEYSLALAAAGVEAKRCVLSPEDGFASRAENILSSANGCAALFVCTPGNPTGALLEPGTLAKLAQSGKRILCDISFLDFARGGDIYRTADIIKEYPNIVFLYSYTKSFAIPGVRLGAAVCADAEFLEEMAGKTQCWNVSVPAQAAGLAALECGEWLKDSAARIRAERERVSAALVSAGAKVYKSEANFLLVQTKKPAVRALAETGITVRDCGSFCGLTDRFFRAAVRRKEDNDLLAAALTEVLK